MAAPSAVTVKMENSGTDQSVDMAYQLVTSHNLLVGAVRAIAAKLDLDGGVTGTDYFSVILDAAGTHPAKALTITDGL